MTLQQTHELQRRELISLRAEVARLKKQTTGLFPVEEKEALESDSVRGKNADVLSLVDENGYCGFLP